MEIVEVKILCEYSLFEFECEVSNVIKTFSLNQNRERTEWMNE